LPCPGGTTCYPSSAACLTAAPVDCPVTYWCTDSATCTSGASCPGGETCYADNPTCLAGAPTDCPVCMKNLSAP
jgi:hypothetical protein